MGRRQSLDLIAQNRLNQGVLAYLARNGRLPLVAPPEDHPDPYLKAGSHPDVVARIWDELGKSAPGVPRCLLHGTPALFLARSGLVVAVALGTSYALRLAPEPFGLAARSGAKTEHRFTTVDFLLDLRTTFGGGWVFGGWHKDEATWFAASVASFAAEV